MKRFLVLLALVGCSMWAMAWPTVDEVQTEVRQGRFAQAETMMKEVVDAKPNSAKGHYVYAEILAHNGKHDQALQETKLARQIDPDIRFTAPEKFQAFEQSLQQRSGSGTQAGGGHSVSAAARTPAMPAPERGLPSWVWGVGGLVIAMVIWRLVSRRKTPQAPAMMAGSAGGNMPYNGYQNGPMAGGGMGSGMMGAGLAGVGGFAAGMLAEKLIHGQDHNSSAAQDAGNASGLSPGHFDNDRTNQGSTNDSIDFGGGGDWGGDSSSSDGGGSGGDW